MPQAYFIREAYFTLRSNTSLVPHGTNFIEKKALDESSAFFMAPPVGLEPTTFRLTAERSTD